ncbi:MAG TPA: acetyl-CoA C-acetyltransferase [Erysipelothrix sp.]|nr:acetyl-CoA C-acetyltransferase [Erysipelothrix sp.]
MSKIYITAAKRTPIASFLGSLKNTDITELGALVIKQVVEDSQLSLDDVNEVIMGHVLSAGVGQGPARQASVRAGIPVSTVAYSLNMLCGSGMKSVINGYKDIKGGFAQAVVAGGMEAMSSAPMLLPGNVRSGNKMGNMNVLDHMVFDGLTDAFDGIHMGITAENIAEKYNIDRQTQDEFAYQSQQKAIAAVDAGAFKDEIVPVEVKVRRNTVVFDQDEYPNRTTNLEKLSNLRAAFKKDGSVTAGNASGINDAASAVMLVSDKLVAEKNLTPLVEIIGFGQGGVDPKVMGLGPTPAIKMALEQAQLTLDDMEVIELNEAFAAQSLGVVHELVETFGVDKDALLAKTNILGGAIALGHPIGVSGNRIIVTLVHLMKKHNYKYGLASLCIGGGMGTAVVLKNVE